MKLTKRDSLVKSSCCHCPLFIRLQWHPTTKRSKKKNSKTHKKTLIRFATDLENLLKKAFVREKKNFSLTLAFVIHSIKINFCHAIINAKVVTLLDSTLSFCMLCSFYAIKVDEKWWGDDKRWNLRRGKEYARVENKWDFRHCVVLATLTLTFNPLVTNDIFFKIENNFTRGSYFHSFRVPLWYSFHIWNTNMKPSNETSQRTRYKK